MTQKEKEKVLEYAVKIMGALAALFDEDSENVIDIEELQEGKNFTHFMHALATVAPYEIYYEFSNQVMEHIEFNHMANRLCFQYGRLKEDDQE